MRKAAECVVSGYIAQGTASKSKARRSIEEVVEELRDFAKALRPPALDDLGLLTAIRRLLADLIQRAKIAGDLRVVGAERRRPPDVELAMFRIGQQALRNVERHARATKVTVTMSFAGREARLDVVDNGVGFTMPADADFAAAGHLGLLGVRERAESLGGSLRIQSRPRHGTEVAASIPVQEAAARKRRGGTLQK